MTKKYTVTFDASVHTKFAVVGALRAEAQKRQAFAKYFTANSCLAAQARTTASELKTLADTIESTLPEV